MGIHYGVGNGDGIHVMGTFTFGGAVDEHDGYRSINKEGYTFVFQPKAGSNSYKRTPTFFWCNRKYLEMF